uniref:Uncharacterized protein n=1 Tax=Anguilla anguilla TaxID=7936 RepID=A0A0E9SZ92_ANGAN
MFPFLFWYVSLCTFYIQTRNITCGVSSCHAMLYSLSWSCRATADLRLI